MTDMEHPFPVHHSIAALPPDSRIRQIYPDDLFPNGGYVQLPYGRTRYWLLGPEDGVKVVLIHGLSTPGVTWTRYGPYLAERGFRVLVYDLYGKGYSDAPKTAYIANIFVTQLALLLQYLKWEHAHIAGFSMGGGITAAFAATLPHLVSGKIVLMASAGVHEVRAHYLLGRCYSWIKCSHYSKETHPRNRPRGRMGSLPQSVALFPSTRSLSSSNMNYSPAMQKVYTLVCTAVPSTGSSGPSTRSRTPTQRMGNRWRCSSSMARSTRWSHMQTRWSSIGGSHTHNWSQLRVRDMTSRSTRSTGRRVSRASRPFSVRECRYSTGVLCMYDMQSVEDLNYTKLDSRRKYNTSCHRPPLAPVERAQAVLPPQHPNLVHLPLQLKARLLQRIAHILPQRAIMTLDLLYCRVALKRVLQHELEEVVLRAGGAIRLVDVEVADDGGVARAARELDLLAALGERLRGGDGRGGSGIERGVERNEPDELVAELEDPHA